MAVRTTQLVVEVLTAIPAASTTESVSKFADYAVLQLSNTTENTGKFIDYIILKPPNYQISIGQFTTYVVLTTQVPVSISKFADYIVQSTKPNVVSLSQYNQYTVLEYVAPNNFVSQSVLEILAKGGGNVDVSQSTLEVLSLGGGPLHASQVVMEVLIASPVTYSSQVTFETLTQGGGKFHTSQVVMEIVVPNEFITTVDETCYVDYTKLLTPNFQDNPMWPALTMTMNNVINPCIMSPICELLKIRWPLIEPYYAALNVQMLGMNIRFLDFNQQQFTLLMKYLGKFIKTRGASAIFINFLSFILNSKLQYAPLWATNLDDISTLNAIYGTPFWQAGGTWFPTPYYDISYDLDIYPGLNESLVDNLLTALQPEHMVLRNIAGYWQVGVTLGITATPIDVIHDVVTAGV